MRVFSIDPGYARCGVALLEKDPPGKLEVLFSDCVETSSRDPFPERLAAIHSTCAQIIKKYSPFVVAIEKLFVTNNQKTAMQVAEVRGALIALAGSNDLYVHEYTPMQVKNATTGWGGATKKDIIKMVTLLVKIRENIRHDDEYDAIAIGITHFAHSRDPIH